MFETHNSWTYRKPIKWYMIRTYITKSHKTMQKMLV